MTARCCSSATSPGRDLAVSIIDDDGGAAQALPIVEAVPEQEDFYDFESRYEIGRTRFVCPAELDEPVAARASEIALEVYELLGCSGFARVDLMLERDTGELYVLEANAIPGLTETEPAAAGRRRGWDRVRRADRADPEGGPRLKIETQRELLQTLLRAARRAHDDAGARAVPPAGGRLHRSATGWRARSQRCSAIGRCVCGAERRSAGHRRLPRDRGGRRAAAARARRGREVRAFLNICRHRGGRVFTRPRAAGTRAEVPVSLLGVRPRRRAARPAAGAGRVRGPRSRGARACPGARRRAVRADLRPGSACAGADRRRRRARRPRVRRSPTGASTAGTSSTSAAACSTPTGS